MKVITNLKFEKGEFDRFSLKGSVHVLKECELITLDNFYCYDAKNLEKYELSIVYDNEEEQYYIVDNKTHLILSTHLSLDRCICYLDRTGYGLIELKRKYDPIRYQEDVERWEILTERS